MSGSADDDSLSHLNRLEGTSEPFATALWNFWISDAGPGRLDNVVLKCPLSINKRPLDLQVLWHEVNIRGGYEDVKANKLWSTVGKSFFPPPSCTNLSYIVRNVYEATLFDLEGVIRKDGRSVDGIQMPETVLHHVSRTKASKPSKPSKAKGQSNLRTGKAAKDYGAEVIGRKVKVLWPRYRKWYSGVIVEYDDQFKSHLIHYNDGEQKWTDFRKESNFAFIADDSRGTSKKQKDADLVQSSYKTNERAALGEKQFSVPLIDDSHNDTGVRIRISNKSDTPKEGCGGVTKVMETDYGYEIFAMAPGFTLNDVSVSCNTKGKVALDCDPCDDAAFVCSAIHQTLELGAKINVSKTIAMLTVHGLLYIKVPTL